MQFDVKWSRVESGSEIPGRRVEKKNLKCRGQEEGRKKLVRTAKNQSRWNSLLSVWFLIHEMLTRKRGYGSREVAMANVKGDPEMETDASYAGIKYGLWVWTHKNVLIKICKYPFPRISQSPGTASIPASDWPIWHCNATT